MKVQVQIKSSAKDWQDAITMSAQPLLQAGTIEERYIDAMIESVHENGAYICLMPQIAMPHARSEKGALGTGVAVTKLQTPIMFPEDNEISLLLCLAAADKDQHTETLQALSEFFIDEDLVEEVLGTDDPAVIEKVFAELDS